MDRLIDDVLLQNPREEKRWKSEAEYERKEARIMSKREKVRKPIKSARLLRDNNDTTQTYRILRAVSGSAYRRGYLEFAATNEGRRVLETPVRIEETLRDHTSLRALPEGTVGRVYAEFMEREKLEVENLLAAARAAGFEIDPENPDDYFSRYFVHFELSHDLWHVLTGYGRDPLGELCLLEFTRGQWPNLGLAVMCRMGRLALSHSDNFSKVTKAAAEAYALGRLARSLVTAPIEEMLTLTLMEVKRQLNISRLYHYSCTRSCCADDLL